MKRVLETLLGITFWAALFALAVIVGTRHWPH